MKNTLKKFVKMIGSKVKDFVIEAIIAGILGSIGSCLRKGFHKFDIKRQAVKTAKNTETVAKTTESVKTVEPEVNFDTTKTVEPEVIFYTTETVEPEVNFNSTETVD